MQNPLGYQNEMRGGREVPLTRGLPWVPPVWVLGDEGHGTHL